MQATPPTSVGKHRLCPFFHKHALLERAAPSSIKPQSNVALAAPPSISNHYNRPSSSP